MKVKLEKVSFEYHVDAKGYQASFALEKCTGNLYLLGVAFGVSFLV